MNFPANDRSLARMSSHSSRETINSEEYDDQLFFVTSYSDFDKLGKSSNTFFSGLGTFNGHLLLNLSFSMLQLMVQEGAKPKNLYMFIASTLLMGRWFFSTFKEIPKVS